MTKKQPKKLFEVLLVFVVMVLGTVVISFFHLVSILTDYQHLFISLLFLLTAIRLAQREPDGMRRYGIDMCGILSPATDSGPDGFLYALRDLFQVVIKALPVAVRETIVAVFVSIIIFPFFILGFFVWHAPRHDFTFQLPSDFISYLVAQIILVGLPEEALFRGYFQTRLGDIFSSRTRLFGIRFSLLAIVVQAIMFAFVHFAADPNLLRLAVFFPALLFGLIRSWRQGIGAAMAFHVLCNVTSDLLVRGWL